MGGTDGTAGDRLTGAPRRIVETDRSPLRVRAGPGTGKTHCLIRRVARLLHGRSRPERLLVCTFTRTAAADLEKELDALGIRGVRNGRAGTLHSFCFGLLSRADVLGLTGRVPRPLLKFEERFLLEDLKTAGLGGIRDCEDRLEAFGAAWARLQSDEPGWPPDRDDRAFHGALLSWLRFHQAMLVNEIIPETLRYLRENPASPHRRAFDHVLVDEYQDLNRAEQVLLDLLAEAGTLTVVGDDNQSIYSFKHAHPEGIIQFDQSHAGTHDERLLKCRRCPRRVIELANTLIQNNHIAGERILLRPMPANPQGEIFVVQWPTMEEETQGIAQFVQNRVRSGEVEPGRVLVLAPRRQFGYAIRDALNSIGILAHSFFHEEALEGNPKLLTECDAQVSFTLLNLLVDPEDRIALRCWCGFGSNSLRSGAWTRIRQHCEATGESPRVALQRLATGDLSLPYTVGLVDRFRELQTRLEALAESRGQALVDALFPTNQDWAEPFRSIAATIEGDEFDVKTLRDTLRTAIIQPELPTDVDYVRVMSLHKSKGLTADLVVVLACIDGLVPSIRDDLTPAERDRALEEQRRLFYVAITRTRGTLVLSSVAFLPRDLAHRMRARVGPGGPTHAQTIASRFLTELGPSRPQTALGNTLLAG